MTTRTSVTTLIDRITLHVRRNESGVTDGILLLSPTVGTRNFVGETKTQEFTQADLATLRRFLVEHIDEDGSFKHDPIISEQIARYMVDPERCMPSEKERLQEIGFTAFELRDGSFTAYEPKGVEGATHVMSSAHGRRLVHKKPRLTTLDVPPRHASDVDFATMPECPTCGEDVDAEYTPEGRYWICKCGWKGDTVPT